MTDSREAIARPIRGLCIEIEGIWDAFEHGLRAEIGNSNYALIREKIENARAILALLKADGATNEPH